MSATVINKKASGETDPGGLGVAGAQVEIKAAPAGKPPRLSGKADSQGRSGLSSGKNRGGVTIPGSSEPLGNQSMTLNQGSKVELQGQNQNLIANQHYRVNTNNILDDTNNIPHQASDG